MPVPQHLVIIPDGNRRWAMNKKRPSVYGHKEGYTKIKEIIKYAKECGVLYVTVWAFSTENWKRSKSEVKEIFTLISLGLSEIKKRAIKDNTRIIHLGRKDRMPKEVRELITKVEEETKKCSSFCLCIGIDYGGEDELLRAEKSLRLSKDKNSTVTQFLDTSRAGIPNPDLIIRTGGEKRTSGFMPLQSAYAEWIFDDRLFPDFDTKALKECFLEYSNRVRRFGK